MIFSSVRSHVATVTQRIMVAAIALLMTACATTTGSDPFARSIRPVIVDGLDISFMGAVIERGFEEIIDRALYEPGVDDLFSGALDELEKIDKSLSFEIADGRIFINIDGNAVHDLGEIPKDDVTKWSQTMIKAVLSARRQSELFKQASDEDFYRAMFEGAVSKLDRFSRYADQNHAARNRLLRDGIIGLGMRVVQTHNGALVEALIKNGPAATAGVMLNDIIIAADKVLLAGRSLPDINRRLEGHAKGPVNLTVRRSGEAGDIIIKAQRDLIVPDTVTSQVVDGIAEVQIASFNQRTAQAVEKALIEAISESDSELKGLILDLRGDPGGLLDQAIKIADLFLEQGSIAELRGRHPGANQSYKAGRGDILDGLPMVIIVDGRAASAAEILAAALQDNHRAVVVGTVTLGKGSVQTIIRLPNNGEIALTWSRVAAPSGVGLHGLGILPDICLSGEASPAGAVISHLFVTPNPMVAARPQWLNPPRGSDEEVTSLRSECPAETRTNIALDLEVARRIVSDPALLSVAAPDHGAQLAVTP